MGRKCNACGTIYNVDRCTCGNILDNDFTIVDTPDQVKKMVEPKVETKKVVFDAKQMDLFDNPKKKEKK